MNSKSFSARLPCQFPIATLLAAWLTGCGDADVFPASQRVEISGYVQLDGAPLSLGEIHLIPLAGTRGPKAAATITEGVFSIPRENGPLPGRFRVEIHASRSREPDPDAHQAVLKYLRDSKAGKIQRLVIPARYNSRSELTAEIREESPWDLQYQLLSK